jgi:hypothetical protein
LTDTTGQVRGREQQERPAQRTASTAVLQTTHSRRPAAGRRLAPRAVKAGRAGPIAEKRRVARFAAASWIRLDRWDYLGPCFFLCADVPTTLTAAIAKEYRVGAMFFPPPLASAATRATARHAEAHCAKAAGLPILGSRREVPSCRHRRSRSACRLRHPVATAAKEGGHYALSPQSISIIPDDGPPAMANAGSDWGADFGGSDVCGMRGNA